MKPVSFNGLNINDTTNYLSWMVDGDHGLPAVGVVRSARQGRWPVISGIDRPGTVKTVRILINDPANVETLREGLLSAFDPDDETPRQFVVEDLNGANDRYVEAVCQALDHDRRGRGRVFVATLAVHGDPLFRETVASSEGWSPNTSPHSNVVMVTNSADAYPIIGIVPNTKSGNYYQFKRFVPGRWQEPARGALGYPVSVAWDTATEIAASRMQIDGDDLRVWVDGVEVPRWLVNINTAATKIWFNLDFQPEQESTLDGAIDASQTEITVDDDISGFPDEGMLEIGVSEIVYYTGKNDQERKFTGLTRGVRGTTAAIAADGSNVHWLQHDIWFLYGNSAAAAPDVGDDFKPSFNLATSDNNTWDYDDFGNDSGLRPAAWQKGAVQGPVAFLTSSDADGDWPLVAVRDNNTAALGDVEGRWYIYHPLGIVEVTISGQKYYEQAGTWTGTVVSKEEAGFWETAAVIADPAAADTPEAWSETALALDAIGRDKFMGFQLFHVGPGIAYLNAADASIEIYAATVPSFTLGAQQANYDLDLTIENETTGKKIRLQFPFMTASEEIQVDTDERTVTWLEENSSQLQALTLIGGARRDWLRLAPGNNTITITEAGLTLMNIEFVWEERYYD